MPLAHVRSLLLAATAGEPASPWPVVASLALSVVIAAAWFFWPRRT